MATAPNPLLGWQGQAGINMPPPSGPLQGISPLQTPGSSGQSSTTGGGAGPGNAGGGPLGNPLNSKNPTGPKTINRAQGQQNLINTQYGNQLIPGFANAFNQLGQNAGNFFGQLTNLGSPFYQQQQAANFANTEQQGQNAAAQSRDQLAASGYGNTPSGATAGMLGGEAVGQSGNLAMTFLQNLFNNEQMQLAGAQGQAALAGLFNPTQLIRGGQPSTPQNPQQTGAQTFQSIASGIGSLIPRPQGNQ